MANLLKEINKKFEEINKTWADVEYISARGSDNEYETEYKNLYLIPVFEFLGFANTFNYDDGFGSTEVNKTLRIVFNDDTWLERAEYDGSEWFEYRKLEKPTDKCPYNINLLISRKYEDIDELQKVLRGEE